jgi:Protein of unknown function (DUF4058)
MPLHDWTRVDAVIFHDFHVAWIPEMRKVLNGGLLPEGYYALAEQHAGRAIADVLTLHASSVDPRQPPERWPLPAASGGVALADAPPRTRRRHTVQPEALGRARSLAIRHVSGHRLIALIEIVSPANKDRPSHVETFVTNAASALDLGVHLMVVDLFPPGPYDPSEMHGAILRELEPSDVPYDVPADEPATLASYAVGPAVEIYVEHVAVGAPLPEMPLFLHPDRYISVPLGPTYQAAYDGMPAFWREVLEHGPV